MNADFLSAFKEKCPWIKGVYDSFYLIKNFNEKVISEVRKDEQNRLIKEGRTENAARLKGSKVILISSKQTRRFNVHPEEKYKDKKKRRLPKDKEHTIFDAAPKKKTYTDMEATYQELIKDNKLLIGLDFVKNSLSDAYTTATSFEDMSG